MPSARITLLMSSLRAGGGERVMVEIANGLARRGYAVDVVALKKVGEYESHLDTGIRLIVLDAWRMLFSLPKLVRYLMRERPAALLATDEYTHLLALMARPLARAKTRVVLRIGLVLSAYYARHRGMKKDATLFLMKRWYRRADHIIANAEGVADDIKELSRIEPSRVAVIPNPKPLAHIREQASKPAGHSWLDEKTLPIVLGVGRLREQKNFPLLIRAFARVSAGTPARLVIVGGGREEPRLRQLIEELGASDRVALAGYQDNPYAFMGKADVFVLPSLWEGLPNALMEAMIVGVPVIAADCNAGPRELIAPTTDHRTHLASGAGVEYGKYGALIAIDDEDALEEALERFLADAGLRERYRAASRERAQAFDAEPILDAYVRALGIS